MVPSQPFRLVKPDKYQLDFDWEVYVENFLAIAEHNQWDTYTAAQQLKFSLSVAALQRAHHAADLPARCTFDTLVDNLTPIFGTICREGTAATLFDARQRKTEETYKDFMLDLLTLYNQAYPTESKQTRTKRVGNHFIMNLKDKELSHYLSDKYYAAPMDLVHHAEKRKCFSTALDTNMNTPAPRIADTPPHEIYTAQQTSTPPDQPRLHPSDLKAIGDAVSTTVGRRLTNVPPNNYRPPYNPGPPEPQQFYPGQGRGRGRGQYYPQYRPPYNPGPPPYGGRPPPPPPGYPRNTAGYAEQDMPFLETQNRPMNYRSPPTPQPQTAKPTPENDKGLGGNPNPTQSKTK